MDREPITWFLLHVSGIKVTSYSERLGWGTEDMELLKGQHVDAYSSCVWCISILCVAQGNICCLAHGNESVPKSERRWFMNNNVVDQMMINGYWKGYKTNIFIKCHDTRVLSDSYYVLIVKFNWMEMSLWCSVPFITSWIYSDFVEMLLGILILLLYFV